MGGVLSQGKGVWGGMGSGHGLVATMTYTQGRGGRGRGQKKIVHLKSTFNFGPL